MATTRLGQFGIGVEPYGTFDPKTAAPDTDPHNPGLITRLGQFGIGLAKYGVFQPKSEAAPEPEPTGQNDAVLGGKGDNDGLRRRRTIVKPTGLDHRRKPSQDGRKDVSDRIEESRELAAEVAADAAFEFIDGAVQPIEIMSLAEIEHEIGMLLRKKLRTEEEDVILLTLMAALAVA